MATGSAAVRIDQVLHGYDRGHRELASSVSLDHEARSTMLVNSDLLADLGGAGSSYLTCYPLPSASRHVLARTWPAGAGYRPGSVWTHSLVLDFQALALLQDLVALDALLLRTGEIERGRRLKPIVVEPGDADSGAFAPGTNAAVAIHGLYGTSAPSVDVPAQGEAENDWLALALWRQMWPSLRREFSFVTGARAQHSAVDAEWMLRFSTSPCEKVDLGPGLQALLDDLPAPHPTSLRSFLSRYAVEAPNPRAVGAPLAELWAAPAMGFAERLRAVRTVTDGVPLPRLSRDLVTRELHRTKEPEALLTAVKEFGSHELDIDPLVAVELAGAMPAASRRSLLDHAAAAPSGGLGRRVFEAVVRGSGPDLLAEAANASTRTAMVQLRPELLANARMWPAEDDARGTLISDYARNEELPILWSQFGSRMGVCTVEALLHRDPHPPLDRILALLNAGEARVARLVAEHVLSRADLAEPVLAQGELDALEHLGDAQIASGSLPGGSTAWCEAACRFDNMALAPSMLVVGYVAAIEVGGGRGLAAASQVYDPLQRLVRQYRLSRDQERYLQSAIAGRVRGWGLADRVMRSALASWPVTATKPGALALSTEYAHFHDLVDEALNQFGRPALKAVLSDGAVPPAVRTYIAARLDPRPRKSWWF